MVIVAVFVLNLRGVDVGNLGAILLMPIIASVLLAGLPSGLLSVGFALAYYIIHYAMWHSAHLALMDIERVATTAIIMPITVVLVGGLRRRLDAATDRERSLRIDAAAQRDRAEGVLESTTDAFFSFDRNWRYVYINRQAERILGRARADLLGQRIWDVFPPLLGSEFERQFHLALAEDRSVHFEAYYPPFEAWFETHAYPTADGLSIYVHDISVTKRAEASLAVRLEQQAAVATIGQRALLLDDLDLLFDETVAKVASTLHAVQTRILPLAKGEDRRWHPACFGCKPQTGQWTGHDIASCVSVPIGPSDAPLAVFEVHTSGRRCFSDDDVVFLQAIANILATAIQRREARERLSRSEQQCRIMAEHMPEVLMLINPSAERLLYVSPAYEQIWGEPCEELYRDSSAKLRRVHPDDRERVEAANRRLIDQGEFEEIYRVVAPDGLRWVHDRMLPITDEAGPSLAVGIVRDITDEKLAQDNAARLATAQAGNRARDEVLAVVSHDLRSPLQTIALGMELIANAPTAEVRVKGIETARNAVCQMNRLIGDLLDVAQLEHGEVLKLEKAPLDVRALLDDAHQSALTRAEKNGIDLDTSIEYGVGSVHGDRARLQQVLANLLDNALKFTSTGGHVRVDARQDGDAIEISVRDSGLGMRPEDLAHLFDRYWQSGKGDRRGVGLGMAICKGIVEAHGGRIRAESSPGVGTTIRFTIPGAAASRAGSQARQPGASRL